MSSRFSLNYVNRIFDALALAIGGTKRTKRKDENDIRDIRDVKVSVQSPRIPTKSLDRNVGPFLEPKARYTNSLAREG